MAPPPGPPSSSLGGEKDCDVYCYEAGSASRVNPKALDKTNTPFLQVKQNTLSFFFSVCVIPEYMFQSTKGLSSVNMNQTALFKTQSILYIESTCSA